MKFLILFFLVFLQTNTYAYYMSFDKVIYGEDNRRMISELDVEFDSAIVSFSRSILAQVPNWRVSSSDKESISIETRDLRSALNVCMGERFDDRPIVSSCTAFMVGADLIMTAGHCVKDKYDCKKNTWVLDYDDTASFIGPRGEVTFLKEKTYACKELVSWSLNSKLDYALIRLDRKITDRSPLKIRRDGKTSMKEALLVIGHPLGLPKMVVDNIFIRDNSLEFVFKTNADTFSGNSGSPAIGVVSGLVEGMLVRGEDDFEMDLELICSRPTKCRDDECRGESIQRSTFFPLKHIPKI